MRSRETGIFRDEGHYRKLAVVFPDLARLHRGLPVCSESALSAELQSSVPCSQFRDHAYAEEDEDLGEESSSLGRQYLFNMHRRSQCIPSQMIRIDHLQHDTICKPQPSIGRSY